MRVFKIRYTRPPDWVDEQEATIVCDDVQDIFDNKEFIATRQIKALEEFQDVILLPSCIRPPEIKPPEDTEEDDIPS